jgi:hypothetical protein
MRSKFFYNPFGQIAGLASLIIGLIGLFIVTYLAYITGTHFNGLLNIDFAKDSAYWVFITESLSSWIFTTFFMYISGLILSKSKLRFIDILGTILMSRIPLVFAPLIRIIPLFQSFVIRSWQMYFIIGFYLASVVWTVILLFNAYKISCNLKSGKLIVSFIISLILSEICTKIFIKLLI